MLFVDLCMCNLKKSSGQILIRLFSLFTLGPRTKISYITYLLLSHTGASQLQFFSKKNIFKKKKVKCLQVDLDKYITTASMNSGQLMFHSDYVSHFWVLEFRL